MNHVVDVTVKGDWFPDVACDKRDVLFVVLEHLFCLVLVADKGYDFC